MSATFPNLAPSQMAALETRQPQSPLQSFKSAVKNSSQNTQKKLASTGLTLLARIVFRAPDFNFLDIPTADLNITQQEIIDELNERMP
jgi:ABC-type cobalamin/Fe3+-siderophores transport system ATPase subunit